MRARPAPSPPRPGQESVWDYPRPPRVEPTSSHLVVVLGGQVVAETTRGLRVLETSHPPTYYFPPADVAPGAIEPTGGVTVCEFKGRARRCTVVGGGRRVPGGAWVYEDPAPGYEALRGHVAFLAGPMDACSVDGERVIPQEAGFYGGWITSRVAGPFKGGPGTVGW